MEQTYKSPLKMKEAQHLQGIVPQKHGIMELRAVEETMHGKNIWTVENKRPQHCRVTLSRVICMLFCRKSVLS